MSTRREFVAAAAASGLPTDGKRGDHHVYNFSGTPFDIGKQHGEALAREIHAEAAPALRQLGGKTPAYLARYEGIFRERMPAVLDEIRGIGEGARMSYADAFFAATRDMTRTGACTAVVCSGKQSIGNRPLIGPTKDTGAPLDRYRILRLRYASGRRMVVWNYPGWIANLCLSSDGVASTGNSLYAAAPDKPTAPGSFLKRLVMEKRSTQEVLDEIRGMSFENGCLMVGDRTGHMVCIELVAGRTVVRDVSGQAFGHANEILSTEVKKHETTTRSPSSPLRQVSIDRILHDGAGRISVEYLKEAFRNHKDFPLSVCRHASPRDNEITTAAFIADLSSLEMHIAIGNPCVAPFQVYALPA
ncbi:MAG: C45 family peptidase [Bryobacteraceae bacterium]